MKTYGYIFVSSGEPDDGGQLASLRSIGLPNKNIMTDLPTGNPPDRSAYRNLLQTLRPGDTLVIQSLDRLENSWEGILEQFRILTKHIGIHVIFLNIPLLNTPPINESATAAEDLLLQLLDCVAKANRALNRQRQADGISTARQNGVRFGRVPLKKPRGFLTALNLWRSGACNSRIAAKRLKVSQNTFLKWAREHQEK